MWISVLVFLKRNWIAILGIVLGGLVGQWVYSSIYNQGFEAGQSKQLVEQNAIVADYRSKALASEQVYSALLAQALNDAKEREVFSQSQSIMLAKSNQARAALSAQLRKDVGYAVIQDKQFGQDVVNNCVGGLGLNSLRLYKNALGYSNAD